ncbi:MAG TPA: alkaline phosphatase D family protein [Bacteroidota bacterium]|nr:alkaline phosphatase D family protein [Bacteroidota bacterium]
MRHSVRLTFCLLLSLPSFAQESWIRSGPMVGYGEMTETMLWVQTTVPATVQYRYWVEGEKKNAQLSKKVKTNEDSDFIAKVVLTNLKPGTRYEYELMLNGKVIPRPYRLTFTTQPFWQWRTEPPAFSVAFGSCAYINDTTADRPGKPYGGSYTIFHAIAAQQPDLMLWLGDNWYYREVDYFAESKMRQRVARDRSIPELQPLLGSVHHYAIWDDHDYGPNDADRTYRLRSVALEIFRDYWANQMHGTLETPGVFYRFQWGDVEFFMLDDRFYRSPNALPETPEKTMFGKAQLAWLKESLVSSMATFKVIVNGNQFLSRHSYETLRRFPSDFDEFIGWIKDRKISGVLFLSGDRHFAELSMLPDTSFYPLYDFTSSPLTAGVASERRPEENALLVPGTFVNNTRNFGMLRFDGPAGDRRVSIELYDSAGTLRWSRLIRAGELKPAVRR